MNVFGPPLVHTFSGSNAGDEGEGLLLNGVLVSTVTALVRVGVLVYYDFHLLRKSPKVVGRGVLPPNRSGLFPHFGMFHFQSECHIPPDLIVKQQHNSPTNRQLRVSTRKASTSGLRLSDIPLPSLHSLTSTTIYWGSWF